MEKSKRLAKRICSVSVITIFLLSMATNAFAVIVPQAAIRTQPAGTAVVRVADYTVATSSGAMSPTGGHWKEAWNMTQPYAHANGRMILTSSFHDVAVQYTLVYSEANLPSNLNGTFWFYDNDASYTNFDVDGIFASPRPAPIDNRTFNASNLDSVTALGDGLLRATWTVRWEVPTNAFGQPLEGNYSVYANVTDLSYPASVTEWPAGSTGSPDFKESPLQNFFEVPAIPPVSCWVVDQLGGSPPFIENKSTTAIAHVKVDMAALGGNWYPPSQARFEWWGTDGKSIKNDTVSLAETSAGIYEGTASMSLVGMPTSSSVPYTILVTVPLTDILNNDFTMRASPYPLTFLYIPTAIATVEWQSNAYGSGDDQWFNADRIAAVYTASIDLPSMPYSYAEMGFFLEMDGDPVPYTLAGSGLGTSTLPGHFGNTSWDVSLTGTYTHIAELTIPPSWIDPQDGTEFAAHTWTINVSTWTIDPMTGDAGRWVVLNAFNETSPPGFPLDDPVEAYMATGPSFEDSGVWRDEASAGHSSPYTASYVFEKCGNATVNIVLDPKDGTWLGGAYEGANWIYDPPGDEPERERPNVDFTNTTVLIEWHGPMGLFRTTRETATWLVDPNGVNRTWAFDWIDLATGSIPTGSYWINITAWCNTGWRLSEIVDFTVVYRVKYLDIYTLEDEYEPCMKVSIVAESYTINCTTGLKEPVESKWIAWFEDPDGMVYLGNPMMYYRPSWTKVKPFTAWSQPGVGTGATFLELPSDAILGEWTVKAVIVDWMWAWDVDMEMFRGDMYWDYFDEFVEELEYNTTAEDWEWYTFTYSGPSWANFEVSGSDVHGKFGELIDGMDEGFNLTWEVLADILANQDEMATANDENFAATLAALEDVMDDLVEMGADIDSINDYVREIRALTQRIDRWRTESAEAMADHLMQVLDAVEDVNNNVNAKWADFGNTFQNTIFGVNANDPRSLSYKIANVRTSVQATVVDSLNTMIAKMDTINAGLAGKLTTILNAIYSESGGLDESIRSEIKANINYAVSSIREKVDQSTATLGSRIGSAADGLHGKFSGVISEIGHVSDKVDVVNAKLGGVETNINDRVDSVDASVGTKLLVAIILIVIVLILVLLPIVAPGFRMKE
jgi:hypothetical protein